MIKHFASCPRGFEELLYNEMQHYNFSNMEITRGGVNFKAKNLQALNFVLETRIASRVYREIGWFDCKNEKEIVEKAKEIPWTKIMNPSQTIKIGCILSRDVLHAFRNSHYLSLLLKDAIVDSFTEKTGKRPSINLDDPDYNFLLRLEPHPKGGYKGLVLLDIAGFPLHQRGYRPEGHDAPIKENYAAALLDLANWTGDNTLYDIFCGTGTFLIEGAIKKYHLPPTFLRLKNWDQGYVKFKFENHKWYQKDENLAVPFKNLVTELINRGNQGLKRAGQHDFIGWDINRRAVEQTKSSWKIMGLPQESLLANVGSALKIGPHPDKAGGTLISNPPYGVRLDEKDEELEDLYYNLGENLKNSWKGLNAFIVSQDPVLTKKISLRTSQKIPFFNGPLECRLLKYELY